MKTALSWGGWVAAIIVAVLAIVGRIEVRAGTTQGVTDRLNAVENQEQQLQRALSEHQAWAEGKTGELAAHAIKLGQHDQAFVEINRRLQRIEDKVDEVLSRQPHRAGG